MLCSLVSVCHLVCQRPDMTWSAQSGTIPRCMVPALIIAGTMHHAEDSRMCWIQCQSSAECVTLRLHIQRF